MKDSRHQMLAALCAVLIVGIYLRIYHLRDRPIWFDEAFSYTLIERFSWSEMVERTRSDFHPPFYYAVLRCWSACFGASPEAMRSLSVVMGAVTIATFYALSRDAYVPWGHEGGPTHRCAAQFAGFAAALLIALSAVHIRWSYEARMYTLATALVGLSTWSLLRALRSVTHPVAWWTFYSITATALLYTHNYGLFSVAAQWLFVVGRVARQTGGWTSTVARRQVWRALAAAVTTACGYTPWIPVLLAQKSRGQADYWVPPLSAWSIPEAWHSLILPSTQPNPSTHAEAFLTAAGLLCVLALLIWRGGDGARLMASMMICPVGIAAIMSLAFVPIVVDRHFLFAYMFLLCAVAHLVAALPRLEGALVLGLLAVNSGAALVHYRALLRADGTPGIRGAMEYLLAIRQADEPIVVMHPCIYFSARYYAGEQSRPHLYLGGQEPLPYTGAPILSADDCWDRADLNNASRQRIWVVDTSGYGIGFRHLPSLPSQWQRLGPRKFFRALYWFEGDISVERYERRDGPGGGRGAEARAASVRPTATRYPPPTLMRRTESEIQCPFVV